MSQAGTLLGNAPIGAGILTVTGNNGIPVGPTILGDVEIVGVGDITVTGNPATNTLEISSAGLATDFTTDAGAAAPVAGNLNIIGTANQVQTAGAGDTVTISFPNDITIPQDLTVTQNLQVNGNIVSTGNINGALITAGAGIDCTGLCATHNGLTNTGAIDSTGTLMVTDATLPSGVVQIDGAHQFYSSNGANGTLLIGNPAAANPVWTNITSADTSVGITNGPGTIDLAIGAIVPTRFNTNAGFAIPAARILTIANGTNTNTSAAGSTVQVNLNPSVALAGSLSAGTTISSTGLMTAGNGLTVASGNVGVTAGTLTTSGNITSSAGGIAAAGTIVSHNLLGGFISDAQAGSAAYYSVNGDIFTANGDISTTTGTVAGRHIVATTDLTISPMVTPGILSNNNAGLVQSSNGIAGQIVMADAGGPLWGSLTAGTGISVINTAPGVITITNTGAGGTKAAFNIGLNSDSLHATGDGFTIVFAGPNLVTYYDATGSFDLATGFFTAPIGGVYQFMMQINYVYSGTSLSDGWWNTLIVYTTTRTFSSQTSYLSPINTLPNFSSQYVVNTFLTAGQQARFAFISQEATYPGTKPCSILALNTFLTGFQVS